MAVATVATGCTCCDPTVTGEQIANALNAQFHRDLAGTSMRELIERSSVNAGAAASYRARATAEDYAAADAVLDQVDELDAARNWPDDDGLIYMVAQVAALLADLPREERRRRLRNAYRDVNLQPARTSGGIVLTEELLDRIVHEAEQGYDLDKIKDRQRGDGKQRGPQAAGVRDATTPRP